MGKVRNVELLFEYGIRFTWLLGVLLVLPLQVFVSGWHWDSGILVCNAASDSLTNAVILISCGSVCLTSYLFVIGRIIADAATPSSVQTKYFRRAAMYPLNFLITYGVILVPY